MRESVRTFLRPKRRRRLVLAAVAVSALAVAVPVALATFTDVPPDNPFYADINAIQRPGFEHLYVAAAWFRVVLLPILTG